MTDAPAPRTAAARGRHVATARLAAALAMALLVALISVPGAAVAQGAFDFERLLGRGADAAPEADAPPAPAEPERERPADLAVYGQLGDYESEMTMARGAAENVGIFRQRLERILREAPRGLDRMTAHLASVSPDGTAGYFAGVVLVAGILILIGRAVVTLFAVYLFRPVMIAAQRGPPPAGIADKLPVLALRFGITLVAAAINLAVVLALGLWLVADHAPTQITAGFVVAAYAIYVLVDTAWRMVLSPYLPDYRIPALDDLDARRLYIWMSAAAGFSVVTRLYVQWMGEIGLSPELVALNDIGFNLASVLIVVAMVWANRRAVTGAILRGQEHREATWIAAVGARLWAPLVTLYFAAALIEESVRIVLGLGGGVPLLSGAFITLMLTLVVYAAGVFLISRLMPRRRFEAPPDAEAGDDVPPPDAPAPQAEAAGAGAPVAAAREPWQDADIPAAARSDSGDSDGDGDEEGGGAAPARASTPAPEPDRGRRGRRLDLRPPRPTMTTFRDLAERVVSLIALGSGAYVLALIWGGPALLAEGGPWDTAGDLLDTLLIGYVAYHAARIWLDARIAEEGADEVAPEPGDEGGGGSAASRLGTLLPLFRSAVLATIATSALVILATELGVNVAPLFAGAGIVGLAVGFGAQTLVRDILSGMFFLLDDAFRKGEYIDVGSVKGTVEKISLRSFQLRHHLGALHTIPFGEITHLTNFSRDWVMMKLPLRLTYDTDVEKVRKLVKKMGQRLLEHPTEGHKFVQPLKSQGVYMMEDSAMIIRIKYMTRPGDQWTTRKLVYQEIREMFEKEGVKFAHREVTVRIPGLSKDRELSEDEQSAVGAAARRAVDIAEEEAGPKGSAFAAAAEAR